MCRNLILLAQNDQQQMVFTCEHGTIHITHQKTMICLTSDNFRQMTRLIVEGSFSALNQSKFGSIRESADQQIELWIGNGGLRLRLEAFFALTDLLRIALSHLDRLPGTSFRSTHHKYSLN